MRSLGIIGLVLAVCVGCSSSPDRGAPLIPNKVIPIGGGRAVSLFDLVSTVGAIAVIQYFYDPLAPNWEIEETRLTEDTFAYSLKMKRYHTGGAGESMQVLKRRATQIQQELGYNSYQLLEYNEGIESQTLGARRVAEARIRFVSPVAAGKSGS